MYIYVSVLNFDCYVSSYGDASCKADTIKTSVLTHFSFIADETDTEKSVIQCSQGQASMVLYESVVSPNNIKGIKMNLLPSGCQGNSVTTCTWETDPLITKIDFTTQATPPTSPTFAYTSEYALLKNFVGTCDATIEKYFIIAVDKCFLSPGKVDPKYAYAKLISKLYL